MTAQFKTKEVSVKEKLNSLESLPAEVANKFDFETVVDKAITLDSYTKSGAYSFGETISIDSPGDKTWGALIVTSNIYVISQLWFDETKVFVRRFHQSLKAWSVWTEIGAGSGSGLELGETSTTAYRGDRGVTAYNHSQAAHAPSDATKTTVTNNLTSTSTTAALSAAQGKVLDESKVDSVQVDVGDCNLLTETGIYGSALTSNYPGTKTRGMLIVHNDGANYIHQQHSAYEAVYVRRSDNLGSTWTTWVQV